MGRTAPTRRNGTSNQRFPKPVPGRFITSEQFLEWLEPGVHADLIGGQVFMHSPVNLRHARLVNFIERLLGAYVEQEELGELYRETVAVRLSVRDTFMPDLAFFTREQVTRLVPTHAPFAPTFALEALSPRSAERDLTIKFAASELHDVQEYWVLDPESLEHHFFRRAGDMLVEFAIDAERIDSASIPGFWVKREWLDPEKLPRVGSCLSEVLGRRKPGRGKPAD
jgi:Uma2 family endonuclease